MAFDNIVLTTEKHVCRITINRPPLNILDLKTMQEICAGLEQILQLKAIKAVVFAGAGGRSFSAGVDVGDHMPAVAADMLKAFHGMFRRMIRLQAPTVAVVNGYALGGGAELALFCDMVVASEKSEFGQPDIKLGNYAPLALAAYPFFIWRKKVYEFLFTGDSLTAAAAERIGLVNRVVPEAELQAAEEKLLSSLTRHTSVAIRASKMAMAVSFNELFERALDEIEAIYLNELVPTEDGREGLQAFLEKRAPVWRER